MIEDKPAASVAGFGPWLIAGTPLSEPYPCRCHESRRRGVCSPLWCPCSGRTDVLPPPCCSSRFRPADWKAANLAYEAKKRLEGRT